jgi:hypothetical protein
VRLLTRAPRIYGAADEAHPSRAYGRLCLLPLFA